MSAVASLVARAPVPASTPPRRRSDARLLVVDADAGKVDLRRFTSLPWLLERGDVVVVNDAATLPASLRGYADGRPIELRIRRPLDRRRFEVVLFGAGDHRTRTEDRARPVVRVGTEIAFGRERLLAVVLEVLPYGAIVRFDAEAERLVLAVHGVGVPVQYAHVPSPLAIWDVQTVYAGRPWATEMPSAGRPLTTELLLALLARGVEVVALTHGAGLSSVGIPEIDAATPPPERYHLPERTVRIVTRAKAEGRRVVAIGTTVVRALEGAYARDGALVAGEGTTDLALGPTSRLRVVDALLSGLHEPGTSHLALASAFAGEPLLAHAWQIAGEHGLASHELGDTMLVLPRIIPPRRSAGAPR